MDNDKLNILKSRDIQADPRIFTVAVVRVHREVIWAAPSEFVTYRLCEQRRFRRACASAQSRQNLRCSLIQTVSQEEPSDRKPDPWPLWMAGHAQLKFVMTECSKTQIRLTRLIWTYRSGKGRLPYHWFWHRSVTTTTRCVISNAWYDQVAYF